MIENNYKDIRYNDYFSVLKEDNTKLMNYIKQKELEKISSELELEKSLELSDSFSTYIFLF